MKQMIAASAFALLATSAVADSLCDNLKLQALQEQCWEREKLAHQCVDRLFDKRPKSEWRQTAHDLVFAMAFFGDELEPRFLAKCVDAD